MTGKKENFKLSIIILSWNTAELLRQCLNSLKFEIRNSKFEIEILVVDNGSSDGSVEYVKSVINQLSANSYQRSAISNKLSAVSSELPITVRLIENKQNLGFSQGNNQGIKQAQGEYIMLLNSDTIVEENAINKLIDYLENHPDVGIIGPRLLNSDSSWQANCGKFPNLKNVFIMLFLEHFGENKQVRWAPENSQPVDWLMGAAFIARRGVFEKIGGLDENIFMYMEEVDWFYRAKVSGFKTYFFKDAQIVHLGRGSSRSGKKDPIINIYKGIAYFYQKHKSGWERLVLKIMLKLKAGLALFWGYLKKDQYLKETYAEALKVV